MWKFSVWEHTAEAVHEKEERQLQLSQGHFSGLVALDQREKAQIKKEGANKYANTLSLLL